MPVPEEPPEMRPSKHGFLRKVDLDLWAPEAAENLPKITVTGQGLRFEGSEAEFDRLCLILGGWLKSLSPKR